jgi:hypothetical protein
MNDANGSEVARVLRQIEQEEQAMKQGLNGLAMVARHAFITQHMVNMVGHYDCLQALVGEERFNQLLRQRDAGDEP